MLSKILKEHIPIDVTKMRSANFTQEQLKNEQDKIARIEHGSGWKKINQCPLCGNSNAKEFLIKYSNPLLLCANCELAYHEKIPANLDDIYKDEAYKIFTTEETSEHFEYKKNRFGKERVSLLESICGNLAEKKILDVGCGNGYFLAAAKEKSEHCFGSEFSK